MNGMDVLTMEWMWRPVTAPGLVVLAAGVLAVLAAVVYARSARSHPGRALPLLALRLAAIGVLAGLLMGPSVIPPRVAQPGKPKLTVLLDTSGSMLTEDVAGRSRLDHILDRWLTAEQLDRLDERFDLRLIGFDESSRSISPGVLEGPAERLISGRATHYAQALTDILLDARADAEADLGAGGGGMLLVIGDGHDTDRRPLGPAASLAAEGGVPIHTLAVGSEISPPDVAVAAFPRQEYLLSGEPGQVVIQLHQAGLGDAVATVRMGGEDGDEPETVRVPFEGEPSATIELPVEESEPGVHEYTVSVDPIEGEAVTSNNEHTVFVEVTGQRMRVLVLEGEPYWDTKFLAQSLRADPRVELVQITQVSETKREGITTRGEGGSPVVPETAEGLAGYDVIVLGRGLERVLPVGAAELLGEYVAEAGGQVVFARGRAYDQDTAEGRAMGEALAAVEPVVWGRGVMRDMPISLTPAGRSSPAFSFAGLETGAGGGISDLPGLAVMERVERVKPAAEVLARVGRGDGAGEERNGSRPAAMVVMNYGRGRVFAVLGEGLWRWSFLPSDQRAYEGVFEAFWSNTVRWLAMGGDFQPGEEVSLNVGRSSVRLGDPLRIDIATKFSPPDSFAPEVTLVDPDGEKQPVNVTSRPGMETRMQATVTPDQTGVWRVTLNADPLTPAHQERRFSVYDVNTERLRTAARPEVLRELAERTGGLSLDAARPIDLAEQLERRHAARLVPPRPRYVWDSGWLLAVLLMWIGLEWVGRRWWGWL